MRLATLLRRSGTTEDTADDQLAAPKHDDDVLRREWDHLRQAAETDAERTEIDAFFSRVMP